MSIGFKSADLPEEGYIEFPADKNHVIRTGINSTLDSPIKILEEHIDNSKDAKATNVTVILDLFHKGFIVEDDGRGIRYPTEVVTFGSGHKEEEARQDPTVDYSGRFGEGAKSTLRIAKIMDYYSNNGTDNDIFIRLRSPNNYDINKCILIDDKRPGGSCKPTVGTRVMAGPIGINELKAMLHEIADHTGRKFAWLLATKEFRVTVRIIDENGKERPPFMLSVPPSLTDLFGDYPEKRITVGYVTDDIGREYQVEGLFTQAEKKSDRKIYFACHRRTIKQVPTEYNVKAIVNCDGLAITKDRTGFDKESALTKAMEKRVYAFVAKNYQKVSLYENMGPKDKEDHYRVIDELNKLAEESGLLGRIMPQFKEKHKGQANVNPDNQLMDQYLATTRRQAPAEIIDNSTTLWKKIKGNIGGSAIGGKPPGEENRDQNEENTVDPTVQKREVLVQKVVPNKKSKKKIFAIKAGVQEMGRNKSIKPGFFAIATTEEPDDEIAVRTRREDQEAFIFLNLDFNFFKLNRPETFPRPEYTLKKVLPLISEGATEILYGTDITQIEYRRHYNQILHRLSGVFMHDKGTDESQ